MKITKLGRGNYIWRDQIGQACPLDIYAIGVGHKGQYVHAAYEYGGCWYTITLMVGDEPFVFPVEVWEEGWMAVFTDNGKEVFKLLTNLYPTKKALLNSPILQPNSGWTVLDIVKVRYRVQGGEKEFW